VLETSCQDIQAARDVFARLEAVCKPAAILAASAPHLDIDSIAEATTRPQNVMGMHFFAPVSTTRLLANVRGRNTAPEVCATAMKLGKTLGKVAVLVRAHDGFVGSRMFAQQLREVSLLLEQGALPEQVDGVLRAFGFAMGPITAIFATPDLALEALHQKHSKEPGIPRRAISDQEVLERSVYALINEGARILERGSATPLDLDMIWIHGYGFPVHRGGPMFYADQMGLRLIYETILGYAKQPGAEYWTPAPLLERLAKSGAGFYGAAGSSAPGL
jgi:3-hydroxyacyl-CoA dehydrogenase